MSQPIEVVLLGYPLCAALKWLHSNGQSHGHVTCHNVLYSSDVGNSGQVEFTFKLGPYTGAAPTSDFDVLERSLGKSDSSQSLDERKSKDGKQLAMVLIESGLSQDFASNKYAQPPDLDKLLRESLNKPRRLWTQDHPLDSHRVLERIESLLEFESVFNAASSFADLLNLFSVELKVDFAVGTKNLKEIANIVRLVCASAGRTDPHNVVFVCTRPGSTVLEFAVVCDNADSVLRDIIAAKRSVKAILGALLIDISQGPFEPLKVRRFVFGMQADAN